MKRMLATILLLGVAGLGNACSTYVENEASLAFEPIYPAAHITPEGQAPTGGIFKENGGGLFASDIRARDGFIGDKIRELAVNLQTGNLNPCAHGDLLVNSEKALLIYSAN